MTQPRLSRFPANSLVLLVVLAAEASSFADSTTGFEKLVAFDGAGFDRFGWSVSISGSILVVGARDDDDQGNASGALYVYERSVSGWIFNAKLLPPPPPGLFGGPPLNVGQSVTTNGTRIATGVRKDHLSQNFEGLVQVFVRSASGWVHEARLAASDAEAFDEFGATVAMVGDNLFIGAPSEGVSGSRAGAVYLFERDPTGWVEATKILPATRRGSSRFGKEIATQDGLLAVGEPGQEFVQSGRVILFRDINGTWVEEAQLIPPTAIPDAEFGNSIAIAGSSILVGAHRASAAGLNSGAVYSFVQQPNGTWILEDTVLSVGLMAGDRFGESVVGNGSVAIIGAPDAVISGSRTGALYIFQRICCSGISGQWQQQCVLIPTNAQQFDSVGWSLDMNGTEVVAGMIGDDFNGSGAGAVVVKNLDAVIVPPLPRCPDLTGDGVVNFTDISAVLGFWLTDSPFGDANGDGVVNFNDITSVLSNWLRVCP